MKQNFVETGRVALINYGPDYGKWVVVLDIIDQSRVRPSPSSCVPFFPSLNNALL